jgi:hypothetical protein
MCEGTTKEKGALQYQANFYPEHRLGKAALGKLKLLKKVGQEFRLSFQSLKLDVLINTADLQG